MLIQDSASQFLSQRDGGGARWSITCRATLRRHICRYALNFSVLMVFFDRDADGWLEWTSIHDTDTAQWRYVPKKSHADNELTFMQLLRQQRRCQPQILETDPERVQRRLSR